LTTLKESDDLRVNWVTDALWRHPRLILGLPLASLAVTVVVSFLVRPLYTSQLAFVPETRTQSLNLPTAAIELASQLGIGVGAQASVGPQFYAELLRSRELRTRVLLTRFPNPTLVPDSAVLLDILRIHGGTEARRLENGLRYLDKLLAIDVDLNTAIVHVAIDAPSPLLGQRVAQAILKELNLFNLERRQSQAHIRRVFIEGRVGVADSSLKDVEQQLQRFYEANRRWQSSPELVFTEQRLRRKLAIQEELATTLRREYENARIEEVNDTPVITVIDPPSLPDRKSRPRRIVWIFTALVIALVSSTTGALLWELQRPLIGVNRQRFEDAVGRWRRRTRKESVRVPVEGSRT
jgi:uncharacterized protein involved in exopolysaccharide biosynthesis